MWIQHHLTVFVVRQWHPSAQTKDLLPPPRPPDYNHEPGTLRAEGLFRAVSLQFRKAFRNFALTFTAQT